MPDIKSNNQKIYDYLSSQNVKNIGANVDEFQQKMSDDGNRRKVFDFLNSKKVKNIGANYDEFASLVYDGGQQQEAAPSPLAPQEQEQAQQAAPAQPVAQDNSKWAVPQASQWGDQMDELGKSVMPGKPVSMPEKKPAAPAEPEPDANPFQSRGGLEKEKEDLEGQLEEIRATIDRDYSFSKEYDERNKAYKEQLKKLTDIKYAGNDFSGIDAEKKWLKENEGKFGENKGEYDDLKRRAAEIETQIRIIKQEQNKAALKAQKEENQRYVAPITTSSGGMAPGYDPSYAQKRGNMVQSEQYRMANEIIDSTEQVYGQGDKEDPGLKGNFLERVGTANQQFWVQGVLNNIDSGTFSGGATKGAAFTYARNVADKRTKIANDTLKELGRTDEDINRIAKEISEDGQKLEPIIGQLNAADEELKSMKATIDDMTANGDPNVNTYIAEYNKKVDAYQKIYDEYAPVFERYKKNFDDYKMVESAIKAASQKGMTDGERAVLDAFDAYNEAQDLRNGNVSVWSSSGAAAEQSAEFILDFIITKGFDKVGAKAAKKLASARWLKPLGEKGTKAAAKFLSDMEVAALRTGSLFPRNLQSYSENLIQMTGGPDELGRYHFDRSHLNAALNTALTQYIEYWSEGFGEYFGAGEQALFRKATSLAPYTAIGKTLNQYRGSIGKYLDYGKFDGMFNEMLEEVVGSTLNSLFGWMSGDKVGDADAMKEFFAGEQLATLALSFLPMSAISANTNIRAYGKMRERYEKGANMLESFVKEGRISREELDNLVSNLSEMTPEQATKRIVEIGQKVKGRLPMDYAQNMIGYLEGSYAMSLRHDEWEDSQEKMDIMGAYTATYSNPGMGNAWDLAQGEQSAHTAALNAGFTEEELDQNAFILGQEAKDMKDTDSRRAEILLNYATAKAAKNGLHDRYDSDITKVEETFDADVRENFDNDGIVMTATLPINGRNEVVFIKTKDAKITPEGTLTTPTGEDGLIEYRNVNGGAVRTAKANMFSNADVQLTDVFINEQNEKFRRSSEERFANAEKTISLSGQSRAINDRVGQNVIVDDHNGVYEPFKVERMDDDGASVVISGERKSLQGVARAMGMEIPGGKYLKAPVAKLYPILAKEPDGVTLTTGLDETRNQNQNQTTYAPAGEQAPQTAEQQAPAQEAEAVQSPELGDLRGQTVQFMDKDGAVKNANVLSNSDGWVVYEELNDNGEVVGTGTMRDADFAQAMQAAATPAPAGEAQTPVVEETPVQEPVVEETPAEQGFPVDENGNRVFDHPSVTPEMAMAELYNGIEPGTKNAANRKKYIDGKANAAIAEVTEAENKIAGLQAKKAMVDEWDINDGEELDAFEQRKAAEKKKFDDEIAQIEAGLPELQRKASHWSAVRDMAEQFGQAPAEAQEAPVQEQQPTANREIQRTEEEEAERGEANSIPRKLARRLKRWQKRTGIKVHVCYSMDDVRDQDAKEAMTSETDRRILTGSFDPNTGTVEIYLFNIDDEAELDRSFIHEVVSHKGLRELLGEEGYNELCDRVWDELMTEGDKQYFTGYNRHLEAVDDAQRRAAADEYIARLSENLDFYDNRSIFQKLVDWVKRILGEKLSVGELEYDAKERATGATASMSDEVLRVILSDSMKRYVETTRGGQKDAKDKAEISSEVGGSIETDAGDNRNGQTRFSMKSIVNGGGLDVIENDGKGNVAFVTTDGRTFNAEHPITARDLMGLENTVMFHMMKDAREISHIDSQKEMRIWQAYADQLNAFLQKGVAKDGLEGADRLKALWQWEVENSVYRSVAPNSDEQYKYSLDITRVCKKNEATIRAISAMQRKLGAGLTPGQVMDVYMAGIEEGYQVPCPVCYVFSRYINNGIVATIAINGQKKWGNLLVDPSTLSEEEKRERITMWKRLLDEQEAFNEQNKKQIEQAKKDCSSIIDEIDDLSYQISSGKLKGKERTAAEKRVKLLDNRYRAAFDLVSQSALTQWIKQFAIRQTKNGYAPTADGKKYELWDDTFQGFPDEYALDLRLTAETIEKYPAIQRLRKARGAAGGKEIHFASNNDVGDIPMMLGADNSVNFYQKAVNARTKKERDYFLSKATERFRNAHKYAQQQSLRGGQRMWSWSDNIERLAPDVFVNLLQLQMLGGALQSYSKQLEGVNLVANLQGYVNGSLMGYGKGWTELQPEDIKVVDGKEVLAHDIKDTVTEKVNGQDVQRERYLAKEGSPVITVDGKKVTLLFDDVVGIDPYGRDVDGKHLKGLFDLNSELDKAGNILVGMNDTHIIAAMADDRVFFIIPWHASGNSIHQVQQMLNGLGVKTMVKDYMDYTKVQEEKDMDKKKKKKSEEESDFVDEEVDVSKEEKIEDAEPIREEIIEFWENHKNEKDYPCGLGSIPSGKDGKLSTEQKHYRKLRDAIFDGLFDELPEKDRQAIMNDAFLSQVLRKVNQVVDDKEMTAGDKKFIYPYEYWDESSTYDNADMNGARYLEYCRRLGYKPKFVGKLDRKAKTDFGNFADYKGYWKLLIDRRMYDVNGRFQDLDPVTTDNYDPRTVDPEWTAENFPLTTVADDPGAERIADRAIEKEGRTFKGGVPTANYEGDIQSAVKKYEMVSKLVDLKPAKPKKSKKKGSQFRDVSDNHEANADPQVSEGGVTMFRERTAPAPQKTQKVYKLMRLDNGNLYPLFIDRDAEPIKLGTWYDADSPDMEFLKKMPSGVFLVDTQNGTYTSLEDYKNERGEKVTKLPGIADVEEAAKNGLRWMKITDTERAQRRYEGENRKYENIGINGSEGVSTFAMRPGWHAGSLPTMRQIGKGAEKNLRDDKFVWVEGEISADKDYNEEAQGNPDKDIPTHIPTDGFYMKATNANKKASQADRVGWYVAGAFKPNRIMSDSETRQVIDAWNAEHQDAPVEYDWPRESGKVFNAETMQLEDENPEPKGPNGGGTRFREAPNGNPSNLTDEQWEMVRTPEFKAWFGDWENDPANASKVVDENGEPMVVYHGTRWDPMSEKPGEAVFKSGWFTGIKQRADGYGEPVSVFLNIKNPIPEDVASNFPGLDLNDPSTFGDYDGYISYIDYGENRKLSPIAVRRLKAFYPDRYEQLIEEETAKLPTGRKMFSIIPREPSQIKSATDNNGQFDPNNPDIRFRDVTTGNAQLDYENEIRRVTTQYLLEWQDGDIPVRIAMNKVMAEVGMDHISDDMDYLTRHNLASSIADAQMHQYKLFYYEPMMKTVSEIVDKLLGRQFNIIEKLTGQKREKQDEIYNDLVNFCYAMSGLERNAWKRAEAAEKMRKELEKLAEKWEKESEAINADSRLSEEERVRKLASSERRYLKEREEIEAKYAPRDYSGITGLMGRPANEWEEAEADAQNMVDAFRERLGDDKKIDELWDRIRACTDFNLEHAYKYGLLSRTEYEKLHGTESQPRLWNFYLPLRGFAEATAEEEYSYSMFTSDLAGGDVVKEAKGRVTEADDPFATIRHISEQELIQGVNNWAKQALYNFVLRAGKNTLLTPVEPWYVKEAGSDKWAPAEPREDETLEQFESRMQEAYKKGDARRGRNGLNLNLIMGNPMHRNQHMIRLKINGQEKMIWVNGSPIMAQAVNGVHGWDNKVVQKWRALNRSLSQFYTTYSAKFLTKNKQRDTQFSRIAALVDEGQAYLTELEKNWWANNGYVAGGYPMIVLVSEWNSGKLEQKEHRTEKEQMFIDFMYDGGATGYTMRNTMEQIKRDLEKMVKNAGSAESNIPVISWYTKGISALNEASELLTRFTFYETSRKMGRSRQRAAYDAKESSVNFNRRGLRSGKGVAGWTAAAASMLYLFMNPAIQGLDRFFRLHKSHPWSMGLVDATYFAMGFFNSMMNAMLAGMSDGGDGDDDDKKMGPDWYWNIPEWVRRSNMIIASPFKKLGKWGYLVIALPIEYKAFYAMGELASSIFQRKYTAKDAKTLTNEVIGVVAELMPINPVEGYTPGDNPAMSVLRNIAPDAIAPIIDVATNRSFAGIPLWKENVYDETMPLSQSAFASTPEILNKAVIKLAEASADWPYHIDIPSGAVRGILKGYGGGAYTFVEDTGKFIFADDAHPRRYENFPFISGFSGYLEEDRRNTFNSNALNRYKQMSKDFVKYVRMAAPGEDIDESAVYNNPDELPAKAQTYITLHKDAWILGQMYYEGMKEKSGATTTKVDKRGNVRTVTVKDDLKTLRSEWTKAKNEYARIAKDKNSTDAEKEEAEKAMNKAWLRYLDSEDALVDRLINEEYFHIKQKVENGIPYDPPKDTWSERLYNWTNK